MKGNVLIHSDANSIGDIGAACFMFYNLLRNVIVSYYGNLGIEFATAPQIRALLLPEIN